jgi:hypothetical protein
MPGDRLPDRDADLDHRAGVDDLGGSGRHRLRQMVEPDPRLDRRRDGLLLARLAKTVDLRGDVELQRGLFLGT